MKNVKLYLLSVLLLAAIFILFFAPDLLGVGLGKNKSFPLGTLISWLIFIGFPLFFYLILSLNRRILLEKILHSVLLMSVIFGIGWGFISFLLAGNWNFIFENQIYFTVWVIYCATILCTPLLVLFIKGIRKFF